MARLVLDLNVLIASFLSKKGNSYRLVRLCAEGKTEAYASKIMLVKFKEVIQRDFKVSIERAEQMADILLEFLKLVEPHITLNEVKNDDEDNRVLECAVYSKADYLASWDPHLTDIIEYNGVKIMNPGKTLSELKEVNGIE